MTLCLVIRVARMVDNQKRRRRSRKRVELYYYLAPRFNLTKKRFNKRSTESTTISATFLSHQIHPQLVNKTASIEAWMLADEEQQHMLQIFHLKSSFSYSLSLVGLPLISIPKESIYLSNNCFLLMRVVGPHNVLLLLVLHSVQM